MEKEQKEKIAIITGFFLILLVIIITLFRSDLFESDSDLSKLNIDIKTSTEFGYPTINAKDLNKRMLLVKENGVPVLLDVRPFDSYVNEHILDSINITPDEFPISKLIDTNKEVVVIGADKNDGDIQKTVDELKKEGFKNFSVLLGGMVSWEQIGGITVTQGDPNSFVDQSKVSYVDSDKLHEALKQNTPMFIVDIRTSEKYSQGHIAGAKNIPFDDLEKRRREITEKRVVVVGTNELQEFQASVQMYDMLLASPFVLKGGMSKWEEKGYPVVR